MGHVGRRVLPAGTPVINKQMPVIITNVLDETVKIINCTKTLTIEYTVFLLSNLFNVEEMRRIPKALCCASQFLPRGKSSYRIA